MDLDQEDFTIGSLFSGIDLLGLAVEIATGGHTVYQVERSPFRRAICAARFPGAYQHDDVRTFTGPLVRRTTLVCGGFPCTDVSNAGKREGIGGERSGLWSEYARILGEQPPDFAFIENVRALEGRGLEVVLSDLDRLGYQTRRGLLAAGDPNRHGLPNVGAPHERQRIWILAYADEERLRQLAERCRQVEALWRDALDQYARTELADAASIGRNGRTDESGRRGQTGPADQQRDAVMADADQGRREGARASRSERATRNDDRRDPPQQGLADTGEGRLEGLSAAHDHDRDHAPWHDAHRRRAAAQCFFPDWPPGSDPTDPRWPAWLERNPGCEPPVHREAHGSAGRVDRWRRKARVASLGDSVSLPAAYWAFRGLVEPRGQLGLWG